MAIPQLLLLRPIVIRIEGTEGALRAAPLLRSDLWRFDAFWQLPDYSLWLLLLHD